MYADEKKYAKKSCEKRYTKYNKKKSFFLVLLAAFLLSAAMVSVLAQAGQNRKLRVEIREFQISGDNEILWVDNPTVLPGQTVSKVVRIHNHGVPCQIRARIRIRNNPEITQECIQGLGKGWNLKSDGYYYYERNLEQTDLIFFQKVRIPEELSQRWEEKTFSIEVSVEAREVSLDGKAGEWKPQKIRHTDPVRTSDPGHWIWGNMFFAAIIGSVLLAASIFREKRKGRSL